MSMFQVSMAKAAVAAGLRMPKSLNPFQSVRNWLPK